MPKHFRRKLDILESLWYHTFPRLNPDEKLWSIFKTLNLSSAIFRESYCFHNVHKASADNLRRLALALIDLPLIFHESVEWEKKHCCVLQS